MLVKLSSCTVVLIAEVDLPLLRFWTQTLLICDKFIVLLTMEPDIRLYQTALKSIYQWRLRIWLRSKRNFIKRRIDFKFGSGSTDQKCWFCINFKNQAGQEPMHKRTSARTDSQLALKWTRSYITWQELFLFSSNLLKYLNFTYEVEVLFS